MRKLRVAAVQLRSGIEPAANREAAMPLLREAASAGARFIATPECTMVLDRDKPRMLKTIQSAQIESEIKAWGAAAQELGVWLLLGSGSIDAGAGKVWNRSFVFDPSGRIAATYDKINLFDVTLGGGETYRESDTFAGGSRAVLVAGPMDAKIGLTICYDVRFAPLYSALARAGAEIIAVPAAFTVPTGQAHWETLLRARAIETHCYVIAPAQGGKHEDGRSTYGHSLIIDPWGKVLAKLDSDEPGYITADLDLEAVSAARAKIPAWQGGRDFTGP
ncbi:MAG: amidohydrolase [Proteobacteria bacterium HN_bin10]|nr:MAG: amidohydrolase [Proteobacteria bacterium HN_bin10]